MQLPRNVPQFFFEDDLIAHQRKLIRRWLPASIYPQPVLVPDRPYEGRMLALYGTVLPDPAGGWRMYYSCFTPGGDPAKLFLATSTNGLQWEKPSLGLVDWRGESRNNILLAPTWPTDSPSILCEPAQPDSPWKMLAFQHDPADEGWGPTWGLYAYHSRDGLTWERSARRVLKAGDRTNLLAEPIDGAYVVLTRHPRMGELAGGRAVYRSQSEDFAQWSEPELVLAPDLRDEPDVEFYGMSAFRRHGWFLGLLEYWRSDCDVIETRLVYSRDGREWRRTSPGPFIPSAYDWNRTWTTCASNGPIVLKEQMVFYFGGRAVSHHFDTAQQYGAIGFASLPVDRFCAIEGTAGGMFFTPPLEWPGGELLLNADTRESFSSHPAHANGQIEVEVLSPDGTELPEYAGANKAMYVGNTHMRCGGSPGEVRWPSEKTLNALAGKTIRLRFHLRHARLFTITAT